MERVYNMSNRLYQSVIHQMRDATDRMIGVIDEGGVVIACSELAKIGETRIGIREEMSYSGDTVVLNGYTYRAIGQGSKLDQIVFVEGDDKTAASTASLIAISLSNIKNLYDEKYDKCSFIKNIILDNILPSDIYVKSRAAWSSLSSSAARPTCCPTRSCRTCSPTRITTM